MQNAIYRENGLRRIPNAKYSEKRVINIHDGKIQLKCSFKIYTMQNTLKPTMRDPLSFSIYNVKYLAVIFNG